MFKLIICILLAGAIARAVPVHAGSTPGTGVYHSVHDLTGGPDGTGPPLSVSGFVTDPQQRVCVYCHTPHQAIYPGGPGANGADYLPLWSHQVSNVNYSPPYTSPFFSTHGGLTMSSDPLVGDSRLCMSCHDGITAVDNYYGGSHGHVMTALPLPPYPGQPVISSSGATNHPIGFAMTDVIPGYPGASHPDTNILPLTDFSTYNTGTANPSPTIISRLYRQETMTCSTCHDVHNSLNKVSYQIGAANYLLLGTQTGSGLCLSCHTPASGVSGNAHNW
jgi:hypothetical protein